jgi:predicted nucleic acid-binding protein
MGSISLDSLPDRALVLLDTAPIVYFLDWNPKLGPFFKPLFAAHAEGRIRFAVTTITIAEVLVGPVQAGDEILATRYRAVMETWQVVELTAQIAVSAARLRASLKLKLPDAVQAASALAINADALVTYDRDFSRVHSLRVIPS